MRLIAIEEHAPSSVRRSAVTTLGGGPAALVGKDHSVTAKLILTVRGSPCASRPDPVDAQ